MKKVTLLLVMFVFIANMAMAQSGEVQNAYTFNRQAQGSIELAENHKNSNRIEKANKEMKNARLLIQRAKTSIDNAVQHEKTMNDAKTWHYYGVIYLKIATYPEFADLDTTALEKSAESFVKVSELDQEYFADNQMEIMSYINSIGINYFNQGGMAYEAKDYAKSIESYKKSYETMTMLGQQDNAALLNAVQVADMIKDYKTVVELCEIMINNSYEDPKVYRYMAVAQGDFGNNDLMLQYIQTGREKFPEDESLVNEQINAYLKLGREAEIIDQIVEMATKQTENPIYFFILGTIYSNVESSLYNLETALEYYNKAIEIDPTAVDPYINIGGMYIDKSAELYTAANDLPIEKVEEYEAMMAEAKSYDEKALPFVEKAYELLPNDESVKRVLKTLYRRLKMNDKANALEAAE